MIVFPRVKLHFEGHVLNVHLMCHQESYDCDILARLAVRVIAVFAGVFANMTVPLWNQSNVDNLEAWVQPNFQNLA